MFRSVSQLPTADDKRSSLTAPGLRIRWFRSRGRTLRLHFGRIILGVSTLVRLSAKIVYRKDGPFRNMCKLLRLDGQKLQVKYKITPLNLFKINNILKPLKRKTTNVSI